MDNEGRIIQLLETIEGNTRDIATWLSVAHGAQMREMLETVLDDPRKRLAYEYSDGESSTRTVAEAARVSGSPIPACWTWAVAGTATARRPPTINPTMNFLITPLPPSRCM